MTKTKRILIWVLCAMMAAVFPLHAVYAETSEAPETTAETTAASAPEVSAPETTAAPASETTTPKDEETTTPKDEETTAPKDEEATTPKDEEATTPKDEEATTPKDEEATTPKDEEATTPKDEEATTPKDEEATTPKDEEATTPKGEETTAPGGTSAQKKYTYTLTFAVDPTMKNYQQYVFPMKRTGVTESSYTFTWKNDFPAKSGYIFRGWALKSGGGIETVVAAPDTLTGACSYKIIAADNTEMEVKLYPVFTPVIYSIIVELDGGSVSDIPQITYTVKDEVKLPINPTRPGYIFSSWKVTLPQGGAWPALILDTTITALPDGQWGNAVITAQWIPLGYTMTFDLADGSPSRAVSYDITKPVNVPLPTRTGYDFIGWTVTSTSLGNWLAADLDAGVRQLPAGRWGNVILTANWERKPYTLTFNGAGGTSPASVEYTVDRGVMIPAAARPGYTFLGWKVTTPAGADHNWPSALEANFLTPAGLWGNVTLEAMWNENTVTFSYIPATPGGTVTPGTEMVGADTGAPTARPVANPGYRFVGWYLDAECRVPAPLGTVDALTGVLKPAKDSVSGLYAGGTYYAKFALILSDLTVTVAGIDADESLIFNIVGRPAAAELPPVVLTVAIGAGENSVTVTDLPIGTYTVTEQDRWSWRYAGVESVEITVKEKTLLEPAAAAVFTLGPRTDKWLSENADFIYPEKKKDDDEA